MRQVLLIFSLMILFSCAVKKPACKVVNLGLDDASMIKATDYYREYYFTIQEGVLKGGILKVLVKGDEKPYEAVLVNPFKPVTSAEYDKELWAWQETRDTVNSVVRLVAQVNLVINDQKHCFNLAFEGLNNYAPPLKVVMPDPDQK